MQHLRALEAQSVHIFREAYKHLDNAAMLWSMEKESIVLLWIARKAFLGQVPFPVIHLNRGYEIPELIEYQDRLCREWRLNLFVSQKKEAVGVSGYPDHGQVIGRTAGKFDALNEMMAKHCWTSVILGLGADEEGIQTNEQYFSLHYTQGQRGFRDQQPEPWDLSRRSIPDGSHIHVHPLLDWSELAVLEYLQLEQIPLPELCLDRLEDTRYYSLVGAVQ
jgi:sulfate adenylyltransferase subunit 2